MREMAQEQLVPKHGMASSTGRTAKSLPGRIKSLLWVLFAECLASASCGKVRPNALRPFDGHPRFRPTEPHGGR